MLLVEPQKYVQTDGNPVTDIPAIALKLLGYCRAENWAGYDPYDALNSRLFDAFPFSNTKILRLIFTQAMKRCPVNLRPFFLVSKKPNAKGLALGLSAILKLSRVGFLKNDDLVIPIVEQIEAMRSPNTSYWCWGYSFPWQGRSLFVSHGAPNLVCTVFVAEALLDLFKDNQDERYLHRAISAAEYILERLYWADGKSAASFSYPTSSVRSEVHNANFLGAALLCRVSSYSGLKKFLEPALKVARSSADRQSADGSWFYGQLPTQRWIDNFHTGYNLCALRRIGKHADTREFESSLRRGFVFYKNHFFREDGAPKYFHDRTYPIDIHSVAQSIITLLELRDLDQTSASLASSVCDWAIAQMWDERGFFYYQKLAAGTIRISYMRWAQAWMLFALATLLEDFATSRSK